MDTLEARDADITAVQDIFIGDFNLDLKFFAEGELTGGAGDDLFFFEADVNHTYQVDLFGEQGQDHLFFGNTTYQLVALEEQSIEDRVGNANELEVFWEQNGANLTLYVEAEPESGIDQGSNALATITTVTLNEFSIEEVMFENGLLSSVIVDVA